MRPDISAVVCAFDALFTADADRFVVRRSQASRAVATALGVPWSPALGRMVIAAAVSAGARLVVIRFACYRRLRARALDREEALRRSAALLRAAKARLVVDPYAVAAAVAARAR